jgi:general secretion pathway protein D
MNKLIASIMAVAISAITAGAEDQIVLQFPNTDVRDLLVFYERLTACKIVVDNQVIGQITLTSGQPVSKAKAIELIEQALFANGFSIIEPSKDMLRIISPGKNPRSEGIPLITKPEDIPTGERLISFVIKLQFRQPDEILSVLRQHAAPSPSLGIVLVPDPTARAIIVTERSSTVRNLIKLVKEIDVQKP